MGTRTQAAYEICSPYLRGARMKLRVDVSRTGLSNRFRLVQAVFVICVCCLIGAPVFAGESKAGKAADELLLYRIDPALSAEKFALVMVRPDGSGLVSFERVAPDNHRSYIDAVERPFYLNPLELQALKALVYEVDFFGQPSKDTESATDQGRAMLLVSLHGSSRTLFFAYRPQLYPLIAFLWKIIRQAEALTSLEKRRYAHDAVVAICSESGPSAVLQPNAFHKPLMDCLRVSNDIEQLLYAASGLSRLMTPDEWMGFWWSEIEKADETRRMLLVKVVTFLSPPIRVPEEYHKALTPILFKYLQQGYRKMPEMSRGQRNVYNAVIRVLGEQHYIKAIPILVALMPYGYDPLTATRVGGIYGISAAPLSGMGHYAIDAIEPLLKDDLACVRAVAALALGQFMYTDRKTFAADFSPPESEACLLKRLQSVVPNLKRMRDSDPDALVREEARLAVERIEHGWYN